MSKNPLSAMMTKIRKWSGESTRESGSLPKVNHFYRGSLLAHVCQVWSTSVSALVSYSVYKMTERMTERSHNLHLVGEGNNIHNSIPYKVVNLQAVVARVRSCRNACLQVKPARFEPRFDKKLSCRRETAWCIVLLNSSLSHSRSVNVIGNDTLE